jgi:hypothetical protein
MDTERADEMDGGESHVPKSNFSIGRVLLAVGGVAALVGVVMGVVVLENSRSATLAPVRGRVLWNGNPVTIGAVMTIYDDDPLLGAIGGLDSEGRFELMTNGQMGAAVGRHTVRVASFPDGMNPPPLVPRQYAYFESTPLFIEVRSDSKLNDFELLLEGEAPPQPRRGGPPEAAGPDETAAGTDPDQTDEPSDASR